MLGDRYEVILHDLSHVESSIVGIEGSITHRKIGGPATNYLIQLLREYGDEAKDSINYKNVMPDGRVLRSSTIFIRDNDGKIIGSLCINQDLTDLWLPTGCWSGWWNLRMRSTKCRRRCLPRIFLRSWNPWSAASWPGE